MRGMPGLRRRRAQAMLAALPGVRRIRRPVTPGNGGEFDLYYVRTGPRGRPPLLVVPGGPGMASIAGYRGLRRRAAEMGIDVIMVEHRGVGMSRRDDSGADLPAAALTITQVVDDLAAVLDDACVEDAVVYGASYGTYLAAGLGVRHPARVHAMVLDSPLLGRDDIDFVRRELRGLFWYDDSELAAKVRRLSETGSLTPEDLTMAVGLYGIGGADLLVRFLDLLLDGRRALWNAMRRIALSFARRKVAYRSESDLVGPIGFRELNFAGTPDGLPLDPALTWLRVPGADIPFEGEPFDLVSQIPSFGWPTVVLSGGRDLITPPAVAERVAELVPAAALVKLPTAGHSVLDTRQRAALRIGAEVIAGRAHDLPGQALALDGLPAGPAVRLMTAALAIAARVEAAGPRYFSKPMAL